MVECGKSDIDINRERGPRERALQVGMVKESEALKRAILRAECLFLHISLFFKMSLLKALNSFTILINHVGLFGTQAITLSLSISVQLF
jgi:hypothetical protein